MIHEWRETRRNALDHTALPETTKACPERSRRVVTTGEAERHETRSNALDHNALRETTSPLTTGEVEGRETRSNALDHNALRETTSPLTTGEVEGRETRSNDFRRRLANDQVIIAWKKTGQNREICPLFLVNYPVLLANTPCREL